MKAMTYDRYGDPDVLQLTDQPMPRVGPGEVRIEVHSAAVNPVDWKLMAGMLDGLMLPLFPVIPGWDVAGVVESVGPDTPEFEPSDKVLAYARKDFVHGGTFCEYVTLAARAVARKPDGVDWDQAAGLPLAGLTAYQLLTRLGLREGETVLIHNAAGGVGVLGAQIARNLGARVIGTASEKNHDFLRSLDVEPVDYRGDVAQQVRSLAPEGVDLVADFIGGVLETTRAVLKAGGRHGSIVDDAVQQAGGLYLWVRPDGEALQVLAGMAAQGRLDVPIARTFELERLADAFRENQTGHVTGKLIVHVKR